jgi:tRNA nucleotidyltransferase (CCA-adding enzyme)
MFKFNMELPNFEIYLVGGYIRDYILGTPSKDIDIVCEAPSFEVMLEWIERTHKKVFLSKPEYFTVRAMGTDGLPYDYVMARKDGEYSDGRRPDSVRPGNIIDDLSRRDFTKNAMAYNLRTGSLLDPFGGQHDLSTKMLRCVGSAQERFSEDPLRIIRAIRFCITKGFRPDPEIRATFEDPEWADQIINTVSVDRIRDELMKCFKFDTAETMEFFVLELAPGYSRIFRDIGLWLKPTTEKK